MLKWEEIAQDTWRLRVYDGWLVSRTIDTGEWTSTALCFVPDAFNRWELGKEAGHGGA